MDNFAQLKYMFKKRQIIFTFVLVLATYLLVNTTFAQTDFSWWSKSWDAVIGITTFVIAVLVWLTEAKQEWENKLPKRLTVRFLYRKNKNEKWETVMCCRNAFLAGEGDIRAWGQQLGVQMSGTKFLQFEPFIEQTEPQIINYKGTFYKFYSVAFYLNELPTPVHLAEKEKEEEKMVFFEHLLTKGILWEQNPNDATTKIVKDLN